MGTENVKLVFARWVHLPHASFRILNFMALVTMDEDNPPVYWRGREPLAYALGRMTPPRPADSDKSARAEEFRRARRADFEAVKVAMRPLAKAGVAEVVQQAAPGRNAVIALHLHAATGKAEPVERGRPDLSTGKASPSGTGKAEPTPEEEPPYGGFPLEDQPGTKPGSKSPQVPNSPATAEMNYATANEILSRLPDLGAEYMTRVEEIDGYHNRVIAAASIALAETRIPPTRKASTR
jgi:hypothetical protein